MPIGPDHLLEDVAGLGRPDERFGILVMHGDLLFDSGGQFRHAAKDAATQSFGRDIAEESLDHIEPGC